MLHLLHLGLWNKRLPMIHQTEAAECGLASLAMVAFYHGYHADLSALRSRFSISLKGSNLSQIIRYADSLNFSSRPLRLDVNELSHLKVPCLLHWDMNHFVVLKSADKNRVLIHDPAVGICTLSYNDIGKRFTGVALELVPTKEFQPADNQRRVSLPDLMGKIQGMWPALILVFLMAAALEVFALVAPKFNQWVVDEAIVSHDSGLLNVLLIGFTLLLIIQVAVSLARGWTVMYLATHLNLQWIANVFSHLLRLPVAWFEKRHLGDVVSRFSSVGTIQRTITISFVAAILDGIMAVATLFIMATYSVTLLMVVVAAVVVYVILRALVYRPLRDANKERLVLTAKEQGCFLETIRAVQAIKLFGKELDRRGRWLNLTVNAMNRGVRIEKFMLGFSAANAMLFGMQNLFIFWLGGYMVMDGRLTVGMLFAFTSYSGQFTSRTSSLVDKIIDFKMLSLHAERLADIVLETPEADVASDMTSENLVPRIELINVGFRYADAEPWIVRNLSMTIEPGEALALVGPSGCGKTTLAKLILGLLSPNEGEIRYGNVPIKRLGYRAYREILGVVMQDDQLLAGSIADNISFFDAHVNQSRIEECARLSAVNDDILAMPMGYHTLIGDMGTTLSGGQKQRILVARALYKSPKVLVLDEATSHLDIERERLVNEAVRTLAITRICIAHRPETIAMARRVVHLNHGNIEKDVIQLP